MAKATAISRTFVLDTPVSVATTVTGRRNAFAPGGALACSPARAAEAGEAVRLLQQAGYTPQTVSFPGLRPVTPAPGDIATSAYYDDASPRTIQLVVAAPDDPRAGHQLAVGFSPAQLTEGPCS